MSYFVCDLGRFHIWDRFALSSCRELHTRACQIQRGLLFTRPTERKRSDFVTQSFEETVYVYSAPNLLYDGGSGG
jgi:hypothetical protein